MKKLMLVVVALMLGALVLPGCKAKAEVDDTNAQSGVGVAR
jgi:outer membrane murein-binding lipoprotein Lpp